MKEFGGRAIDATDEEIVIPLHQINNLVTLEVEVNGINVNQFVDCSYFLSLIYCN